MDLVSVAGVLVSGVGVVNDLATTFRDLRKWEERDLEVDGEWLELAKSKGLLPAAEYGWMGERRVPSAELKGTAHTVVCYNKEKRIVYKVVQGKVTDGGGRNVLVRIEG